MHATLINLRKERKTAKTVTHYKTSNEKTGSSGWLSARLISGPSSYGNRKQNCVHDASSHFISPNCLVETSQAGLPLKLGSEKCRSRLLNETICWKTVWFADIYPLAFRKPYLPKNNYILNEFIICKRKRRKCYKWFTLLKTDGLHDARQ